MKKILILNGAPRKNGNTAALINAFSDGARSAGNQVEEYYLQSLNIHGCMSCNACRKGTVEYCAQNDDMLPIYESFLEADVIVFASPEYFSTITGTLKTATDRLYAIWSRNDGSAQNKDSVFLITSNMGDLEQPLLWYRQFMQYSGWNNLGIVAGGGSPFGLWTIDDKNAVNKAAALGRSIK